MKPKTPLVILLVILTMSACSDGSFDDPTNCAAIIDGNAWKATSFQSVKQGSGPSKVLESITATSEDGTSIVFNMRAMKLSPEKLSAEFRSRSATISYFMASIQGSQIIVQWGTTAESNVYYFEVERSYDGVNYSSIGIVGPQGGSGVERNYVFSTFDQVNSDYVYFRLRIVNFDAAATVTEPISVKARYEVYFMDTQGIRYGGYQGKVQLTKYDEKNKIISGTFSFRYRNSMGDEIEVRNGVIENIPY